MRVSAAARAWASVTGSVKRAKRALFDDKKSRWLWVAFCLYFIAYVPYTLFSKRVGAAGATAWQIMPLTAAAGFLMILLEVTLLSAWKSRGESLVSFWREIRLTPAAIGCGIAGSVITLSTNASYMFAGAALITMLLSTRGGMLLLAPLSDYRQSREVGRGTWIGFGFAAAAMAFGIVGAGAPTMFGAAIIAAYLLAYGVNMNFYGQNQGKISFLFSSQLVAYSVMLVAGTVGSYVTSALDFTTLQPDVQGMALTVGLLAQLTGVFGPMILMSEVEQTYSTPINRSGSVLAGTVANKLLGKTLEPATIAGILFFFAAIVTLAVTRTVKHVERCDTLSLDDGKSRDAPAAIRQQDGDDSASPL